MVLVRLLEGLRQLSRSLIGVARRGAKPAAGGELLAPLARWQLLELAECRLLDFRLVGEAPVEALVALLAAEVVAR